MIEEFDRIGELEQRHEAAVQYMHSENCSWDRAARLFRAYPFHELPPDAESLEVASGENPRLDRVLHHVRQGMPYKEAERLVGPVE